METQNIFTLNNKIYSNNNNILLNVIAQLQNIINDSKNDININRIKDIIIILNNIIKQNEKNTKEIIDYISKLDTNINKNLNDIKNNINNINNKNNEQNKIYEDRRYIGQMIDGIREGKGIMYYNDGDRYEGR